MKFLKIIWKTCKVLLLLCALFIAALVIYVLNVYKSKISEKEVDALIVNVKNTPNYPQRIYTILGGFEPMFDTSLTSIGCLLSEERDNSPSQLLARYTDRKTNYFNWLDELSFSFKLDRNLKPKKMANYLLANMPFGNNQRGLTDASNFYYYKSLDSLTDRELISVGAIAKANTFYSPIQNPDNNERRTNRIIEELREKGIKLDASCDYNIDH